MNIMILAIFHLQVTLMIPTKFQINWPFGSGVKVKARFSGCCHLGYPIKTILAIFDLCHPDAFYQVSSQLAFWFRRNV